MSRSISGTEDFSAWLIEQLTIILRPLKQNLADEQIFSELLKGHGWEPPSNMQEIIASFPTNEFQEIDQLSEQIINADTENIMEIYAEVSNVLKSIFRKVRGLTNQRPPLTGTVPFNVNDFWSEFPEELVHELIIEYLEYYLPSIFGLMLFLGIIEENFQVVNNIPGRINYTKRIIHWNLLKHLVNPSELIKQTYGWDSDQFRFKLLLNRLKLFLNVVGVKAYLAYPSEQLLNDYYDQDNPDISNVQELRIPIIGGTDDPEDPFDFELLLSLIPIPPQAQLTDKPDGLAIGPSIIGNYQPDESLPLEVKLKGGFELDQGIKLEIHPQNVGIRLAEPATGTINSELSLATKVGDEPIIIVGSDLSHNISIFDFGIRLGVKGQPGDLDAFVSLDIRKAVVTIDTSTSDSFISNILGSEPQKVEIKDCSIIWSTKRGLHFGGQAGLEIVVPIDRTLGAVKLRSLTLGLTASTDNGISLIIGIMGSAKFGPVLISIENLGIILSLKPIEKDQSPGAFGDLDFAIDFKPPTGLGLAINGNGVKGGGFISKIKDQYSGIIDLDLLGYSIQALAIVKTDPFPSLMFAIFAQFKNAIQLGAGWKITKIGGMLGINHSVSHNKIATGIKSGILDTIMFPDDIIRNASTVIRNFETVFPVLHGQNIFGPAIQVAYGTPTLITADLAVILEFPNPFLLSILGKVISKLPNKDNPIIQINVGIVGALDIVNGKAEVYGSLYDSKILDFSLSGDMAMVASWGSEKNFIFSIGGFNPRFMPPSNFPPFNAPPLKRLNLAFSTNVTFECYLALTSNTLQIGARVDALFKKSGATISGFLGFDALVQFNPLYYVIDVAAGFSVKFKGRSLASIAFLGFIEGPNPHRIKGSVKFSILWWDISVDVDKTFGDEKPELIVSVDPWDILEETLEQNDSWIAELPEWEAIGVVIKESSVAAMQDGKQQLIHPSGKFKVSQRMIPLNHTLTKVGSADATGHFRFEIIELNGITRLLSTQDYFAPGQFAEYPESKKLNLKSYEPMDSGVFYGTDPNEEIEFDFQSASSKDIKYETILLENFANKEDIKSTPIDDLPPLSNMLSQTLILAGVSYHTALSNSNKMKYQPKHHVRDSTLRSEKFIIVDEDENIMIESISEGELSRSIAIDKLAEYRKANPQDKRNLKVISRFELPELPKVPPPSPPEVYEQV